MWFVKKTPEATKKSRCELHVAIKDIDQVEKDHRTVWVVFGEECTEFADINRSAGRLIRQSRDVRMLLEDTQK